MYRKRHFFIHIKINVHRLTEDEITVVGEVFEPRFCQD
jgi:hypothetical protein